MIFIRISPIIPHRLVIHGQILTGTQRPGHSERSGNGILCAEINESLLWPSAFGSNQHDTICPFSSINSSGSGIFKYRKSLYFIYIDIFHITGNTIHQYQRVGSSRIRTLSANVKLRFVISRFAATLYGNHTGNPSGNIGCQITLFHVHIPRFQCLYRRNDAGFLLLSISDYHHISQPNR